MRHALILATCVIAAGCGSREATATWAPPETLTFRGGSDCGPKGHDVQIRVRKLVVGRRSWRVDATLANRTGVALQVIRPHHLHTVEFGLDVFDTNTLAEVERRAARKALHNGALAERVVPPLAGVLRPGDRWAGSFSAPGRLPRGKYVRVVFGRFVVPGGKVPAGLAARFFCTTDDAPRL